MAFYGMPPPELMADTESRGHLKKLYEARRAFMTGVTSGTSGEQVVHERNY